MERFTLYWIESEVTIEAGALLAVGSGAHIYGGVDWVSMAMSADETADLTKPEVGSLQRYSVALQLQQHAINLLPAVTVAQLSGCLQSDIQHRLNPSTTRSLGPMPHTCHKLTIRLCT